MIRRLGLLYPKTVVSRISVMLKEARAKEKRTGNAKHVDRVRQRCLRRMYDVSEFMRILKHRFSLWYNWINGQAGRVWEGRFKSILVQGSENALTTMAAYIDLNPVRAGLVKDPKDYRHCGYAEAVAGCEAARVGLGLVMRLSKRRQPDWDQINHKYPQMLKRVGQQMEGTKDEIRKRGFGRGKVKKGVEKLGTGEVLRRPVRYFTDGVALGSREYVEGVFRKHRGELGLKRKASARRIRGNGWQGLYIMREPRPRK